jgi:hypothetical protein
MEEPELKLCEVCWQTQGGLGVPARYYLSTLPVCEEHYHYVCQRCRQKWAEWWNEEREYKVVCDGCNDVLSRLEARRAAYNQHLSSDQWWKLKKEARRQSFKEHGDVVCARCGTSEFNNKQTYGEGLHCHHRTYERFGQERVDDVELLCSPCHASEHHLPAPKSLRVSDGYSLLRKEKK